ncbi:hypothetical protein V7122_14090 [Bacillus sp. JJ1532]|uniref:O-antigen ligase family protein n=1 Tax=Bacillus sp. JJ1532 TaxID=3122958 RepID=UPI002FFDCB15
MVIGVYSKNRGCQKEIKSIKKSRHVSKTKYALFGLVTASCLGETFNLFGIKLSWVLAILTMVLFFLEYLNNKIRIPTYDIKKYVSFFTLWFIYATLQMLFILQNDYAISSYFSLVVNVFIVIMLALNLHSIDDLIFINRGLILGLIINLLIAFWEIATGNHIVPLSDIDQLYYRNKPVSVFVNGNDLATFICCGIVSVILNYALTKKNWIITLAIIIASVFVLIQIDARAPIYGMVLYCMSFTLIYILLVINKNSEYFFTIISIMLTFIGLIASLLVLYNYSLTELVSMISSPGNEKSDLLRLSLTKEAIQAFFNSAFLGIGPGQSINLLGINVHNFFLEIMSEFGVIIISGIILIFIYLFKAYKWKLPSLLTLCIMSFPPAFVLIGISSSSANRIRATWILITLLYITISLYKKEQSKKLAGSESDIKEVSS